MKNGFWRRKTTFKGSYNPEYSGIRKNKIHLNPCSISILVIIWNVLTKQEVYQEPKIKLSAQQISRKQKYYQEKLSKLQLLQDIEKAV